MSETKGNFNLKVTHINGSCICSKAEFLVANVNGVSDCCVSTDAMCAPSVWISQRTPDHRDPGYMSRKFRKLRADSRLHERHVSKFPFVLRIKSVHSKLSIFLLMYPGSEPPGNPDRPPLARTRCCCAGRTGGEACQMRVFVLVCRVCLGFCWRWCASARLTTDRS